MSDQKQDSFIFYRSYFEAIETLPEEQQLVLFKAIVCKSLDNTDAELFGVTKGMFSLIVPQIEANKKKRDNGQKGAEHGKKGGRPRKNQANVHGDIDKNPIGVICGNPNETPNVNANNNLNSNGNKNENVSDTRIADSSGIGFERFWSAYPRRVGKQDALKAWGQLNPDDVLVDLIVAGLERWKACDLWTKDGGSFICYPATFLRGRRWEEDDRPEVPPAQPKLDTEKNYDDGEDFLSR